MSFLQPFMLFAIPVIALPIVIHLINQRRYQTMEWAAMRFLLRANRMSRGYARLRQWLILACRTLAIAGLIFAACRPLASGLMGLVGAGRADTTIVLLDRSPSMSQRGTGTPQTKLAHGIAQLVDTLHTLGSHRWVVIESDRATPLELDSINELVEVPTIAASSSKTSDVPKMLEAAADYIRNNKTGRTEIWLCSDLRSNDWQRRGGHWQQLRHRYSAFPQSIRFHLFSYANLANDNLSVEVTNVERLNVKSGAELSVSFKVKRQTPSPQPMKVPIQFQIAGARSQTEILLSGNEFEKQGHRIPLDANVEKGWGRISIQADVNDADNEFYFGFDKPLARRTILVADQVDQTLPLEFAAAVAPNSTVTCEATFVPPSQLDGVAWEDVSLVLWQSPLPQGDKAKLVDQYVARGGQIVFFPPDSPDADMFRDVSWAGWQESPHSKPITTWRMDQDLLANTLGGSALPVGELQTYRYCPAQGDDLTVLATMDGGTPLLSRLATTTGGVYFCSTTTDSSNSSLASNGVVLYVAVQRALAAGASVLGNTLQVVAGEGPTHKFFDSTKSWSQLMGDEDTLSTEFAYRNGVYKHETQVLAVNRNAAEEDHASILSTEEVEGLFEGLNFSLVENQVGSDSTLVQEIWRFFLLAMIVALLAEALLCVPRKSNSQEDKNSFFRERQERAAVLDEMQEAAA